MLQPKGIFTLLVLTALVTSSLCLAEWDIEIGGDLGEVAQSIQQTEDGGYIVAAWVHYYLQPWTYDFGVLKLDTDGAIEWKRAYGGGEDDRPYSIRQTSDGGFIVAGHTDGCWSGSCTGANDAWILKLYPDGAIDWQKRYGGEGLEWLYSIRQTSDGGFVAVGTTDSFGAPCGAGCLYRNYWILKLDVAGEIDWQKVLQWPRGEYAHTIEQTQDGGYILAGYTAEYSKALRVIKLYPDGEIDWQQAYPGLSGWRHTSAIRQTEDLGYVAVASTSGAYSTVAVLKLTSDGSVSWQRSYDPGSASEAHSVVQTSDGGYLVAGNTCLPAICNLGDSKIWLLRLDSLGAIVWAKIHQGQFNIFNSSPVQQTQDGGFVVAAHTVAPGDQDMLLLKLDANGEITDPECNTLSDNAPVVLDTSIEPLSTSLVATETPVVAMVTDIAPQDLSLSQNVNCYVPVFFTDGFESGDTSAWSSTVQ